MRKEEINRLVKHSVGIVNSIIMPEITPKGCILVHDPKGNVYEDDVATHHLTELFLQIDSQLFSPIITAAVNWFIKERADLYNPFFVTTIAHTGTINNIETKDLVERSITSQKRKSGSIEIFTAFLDGGAIFSTLWAVEILLSIQTRDEYSDIIENALSAIWKNWEDVHRTSFKGFFLELLLKFNKYNGLPDPKIIIDDILNEQDKNGLWDNSYLYTFYIIGNLSFAAEKYPEVVPCIEKSLTNVFELDREIDGPPSFIEASAKRYAESLFLQTSMRSVIAADRYLRIKGFKNDISKGILDNLVDTWPKLYHYARQLNAQVKQMESQYGYIEKEFEHIREKAKKLLENSSYNKNVFIMMPLGPYLEEKEPYVTLVKEIKSALKKEGYAGWLSTDMKLDDDLWNSVAAYLEGCKYGIGIFTRRKKERGDEIVEEEYFNPNVSLEIGFMLARGKKVLLLKDKSLTKMPSDLVGKFYQELDLERPRKVKTIIRKWISEIKEVEVK